MTIDRPRQSQIPQLRALWKEAFGDSDAYLDSFFHRAFSYDRCRCVTLDETVVAALYWFDCTWKGKRLAYFYAVATARNCQGRGLCRQLMEDAHRHLAALGYSGCILAPQTRELFSMYSKFGYSVCSYVREFSCGADGDAISLQQVNPAQYAAARRRLLPENSVLQEGITLDFLGAFAQLYVGSDLALAAYTHEGNLIVCELLGDPQRAPQILTTLGVSQGSFRTPGQEKALTMYLPLTEDSAMPDYFGLILD